MALNVSASVGQRTRNVFGNMVRFLNGQPGKELLGVKMALFCTACPQHKGTGLKLKDLAVKHPNRLWWTGGKIALPIPAQKAYPST